METGSSAPLGFFRPAYSPEVSLDHLLHILSTPAQGAARAIKARHLIRPLGFGHGDHSPERAVRGAVRALVRRGYPIGTSVGAEAGYFFVTEKYELATCLGNLKKRAAGNLKHAEDIRCAFEQGPRQAVLFTGLA